jgi:hypothetical protein
MKQNRLKITTTKISYLFSNDQEGHLTCFLIGKLFHDSVFLLIVKNH